MAKYKAAPGAQYGDKEAQALGAVVEKLGKAFSPEKIVDAARPKTSPIHKLFEWRDGVAAEKYRIFQARNHANHLQVVIVSAKGDQRTKALHSVIFTSDDGAERAYCQMQTVSQSPELREQVIAKALAEAKAWQAKYQEYRDVFAAVFKAIDATDRSVPRKKSA